MRGSFSFINNLHNANKRHSFLELTPRATVGEVESKLVALKKLSTFNQILPKRNEKVATLQLFLNLKNISKAYSVIKLK